MKTHTHRQMQTQRVLCRLGKLRGSSLRVGVLCDCTGKLVWQCKRNHMCTQIESQVKKTKHRTCKEKPNLKPNTPGQTDQHAIGAHRTLQ